MSGYNSKFTGAEVDARLDLAATAYQKPTAGIPATDLESTTQEQLNSIANKVDKVEGKGLSTNDLTDEMVEKIADAATEEGYYPKMRVGYSDNLTGRGEAEDAMFTYRPTDGATSVESGVATIKRIKGNSVVWNQKLKNALDQTGENGWRARNGVENVSFNNTTIKINFASANDLNPCIVQKVNIIAGHKYYLKATVDATNVSSGTYGSLGFANSLYLTDRIDLVWWDGGNTYSYNTIYTPTENRSYVGAATFSYTVDTGDYLIISDFQLFDLTQMFGAGNEPSTEEEFKTLYRDAYYEYNDGTLQGLSCYGIETVGFNQYNGEYAQVISGEEYYLQGTFDTIGFASTIGGEVETITVPTDKLYTPTQNGYIYATGTDICINLSHTGYRNGEYEKYNKKTFNFPLSEITNGEPLRKAGSVFDEINNESYIQRVGVVDLGSLRWSWVASSEIFVCYFMPEDFKYTNEPAARLDGLFCAPYPIDTITPVGANMTDKTMKRNEGWFYIKDTSYDETLTEEEITAVFKADMSGVLLNYELAEPIVTPIPAPFNLAYEVDDFGTERALLAENSAPFSADIVYQFNAVDRIRASANREDIEYALNDKIDIDTFNKALSMETITAVALSPNTYYNGYGMNIGDYFAGNKVETDANIYTATVAVKGGEVYRLKGKGNANGYRGYIIVDSSNIITRIIAEETYDAEITIGANECKLYCNLLDYNSATDGVWKITSGSLVDIISSIGKKVDLPLNDVKLVCFGDSITQFTDSYGYSWTNYLNNNEGATVYNVAIGGSQIRQRMATSDSPLSSNQAYAALDIYSLVKAACEQNFIYQDAAVSYLIENGENDYSRIISTLKQIDFNSIDMVIIFGGTNDWLNSPDYWGDFETSTDAMLTSGAIRLIIQTLCSTYPHLQVMFITPIVRWISSSLAERTTENWGDNYKVNDTTLKEFVSKIKTLIKNEHLPICDLYTNLGWNQYNFYNFFYDDDGTHPYNGFKEIAKAIANFINSHRHF